MDAIVKRLIENRYLNEEEEIDSMFDEDLKKYKGKAMKELLVGLSGQVKVDIRTERPTHYGTNGFAGRVHQITWDYADMIIKDIAAGSGKYVDVYIKL